MSPTRYRYVAIDDLNVFYRDTGPSDAPAVLLLHGFPSSSRMWQPLIDRLGDRYRMVTLTTPASDIATRRLPTASAIRSTTSPTTSNGSPTRSASRTTRWSCRTTADPSACAWQSVDPNGSAHSSCTTRCAIEDGLGPLWETRRAFWSDRARHEQALRENFFSPTATRVRHVGHSPDPDRYDPDLWTDELAFLNRPGQRDIQTDLFYDYRTNVASYPVWQQWLRETQPPLLVVWGRYDRPSR